MHHYRAYVLIFTHKAPKGLSLRLTTSFLRRPNLHNKLLNVYFLRLMPTFWLQTTWHFSLSIEAKLYHEIF